MDTKNITGSVRTVCIVAFPGAEILDITGPLEVFAFANNCLQLDGEITEPAYQIALLAENRGPWALHADLGLSPTARTARLRTASIPC